MTKNSKNVKQNTKSLEIDNHLQQNQFDNWITHQVEFDPLTTVSLEQLHLNYCYFISREYKTVPFSKKLFSMTLKIKLKEKIENKQIQFFTRSRIFIRGIKLPECTELFELNV